MADMTLEHEINGLVAGCDEAGRGPWAGPIIAAAVVLPKGIILPGVNDSKSVSKKRHRELADLIMEKALSVGIGIASNEFIDKNGLSCANKYVIRKAIENLDITPDHLLIDGGVQQAIDIGIPQREIPKGDTKSLSIAAASIIAKSVHDELMRRYAEEFPQYGWLENAGYGTMAHRIAIREYGVCKYHRKSVRPIREFLEKGSVK